MVIAFKALPTAVGTDIAGSIRGMVPPICAETQLRSFSDDGSKSGIPEQEYVLAVNGPMSKYLGSLSFTLKLRCQCEPLLGLWTISPYRYHRGGNVIQPKGRKLRLRLVGPHDSLVTC